MKKQEDIFSISSDQEFNAAAVDLFHFQYNNNRLYKEFTDGLNAKPERVIEYKDIPFLPIDFFKTHRVISSNNSAEIVFESSGTTGATPSRHHIADIRMYEKSFREGFELFYGPPESYCILALLPSYLERKNSSLVYMVNDFIKRSGHPRSGFYLDNLKELADVLEKLSWKNLSPAPSTGGDKIMLIGVSFALLELAEKYPMPLKNTIIMETGGMKGRRKELIREELHGILKKSFQADAIHSEYGMTELLSQAYSKGEGKFNCPPWIKILIRDVDDPLTLIGNNKTGGINVIDLANVNSCAFIATQDLGKTYDDGSFEVLGRFDNSDIRGCNLMSL